MDAEKIVQGKRVLVVDDEADVLESLMQLLDMCEIDAASSFEDAKKLLEENYYDITVLDIMGVRGYDLLKIANSRRIPAIMLTAHALSKEDLNKSADEGAAFYAPKDEINQIAQFMADVFLAIEEKKSPWLKVFERLGSFYDKRFSGTDWRKKREEYWKEKLKIPMQF